MSGLSNHGTFTTIEQTAEDRDTADGATAHRQGDGRRRVRRWSGRVRSGPALADPSRESPRRRPVVDLSGHVAMGLLFALPVWLRLSDRRSLGFVALAAVAALVPDIDLWLVALVPEIVHHHGVTHTIIFVTIASVIGGAVVAGAVAGRINEWLEPDGFARP